MRKRILCFLTVTVYAFTLYASALPVSAAAGEVLLEETFTFAGGEEGTDIGGWNGWQTACGNLDVYTLDSEHTLAAEPGTDNGVGRFYRSDCSGQSAAFMSEKRLDQPAAGGKVSVGLRINRANYASKLFLFRFYDTAGNMMGFTIDLASSRIYAEGGASFPNYYFPGITQNTQSPLEVWQELEWALDFENGVFDCYYGVDGGEKSLIAEGYSLVAANNGSIARISIGTQRNANAAGALFYVDDLSVRIAEDPMTNEEACTLAAEKFADLLAAPLTEHVTLPATGAYKTLVDWKSADENVITSLGRITRLYRQDQKAVLTAVFSRGDFSMAWEYQVTVRGLDEYLTPTPEIMQDIAAGFAFSNISEESICAVSRDLTLPDTYDRLAASAIGGASISWESGNPALISEDGTVHRAEAEAKVRLTARFAALRDETMTAERQFDLTLLPEGELYYYETFDSPESAEGQDIDGWNGWVTSYGDPEVYRMDSYFTLVTEAEGNKAASFLRPTCDAESMYVTTKKTLERPVDGGTVSLKFRINRKNSAAKVFLLQITDTASHTMEFVVDLGSSRLYSGGMDTPAFPTFYFPGIDKNTPSPENQWQNLELTLKLDEQTFDCRYDGTQIAEGLPMITSNNGTIGAITLGTNRTANTGGNALFYVDDITMVQTSPKIEDRAACEAVAALLEQKYAGIEVAQDIEFQTGEAFKTTVVWETADSGSARIRGNVLSVTRGEKSVEQVLTARIYRNQTEVAVEIPVTIRALDATEAPVQEAVDRLAAHFDFSEISDENPGMVTQPLNLMKRYDRGEAAAFGGVNIAWESSRPHVIDGEGRVAAYQYDAPVILTATFSAAENPALTAQKQFAVTVLSEGRVLFKEDFEDARIGDMNQTIDYNGWTLSRGDVTHIPAADARIEFDAHAPGNRILHMTRTVKNSSTPPYAAYQLVQKSFDRQMAEGVLVLSMRFKVENSTSRVSMILHDSYGSSAGTSIQISQYYAGGKKLEEPLVFHQWYTAVIVLQMNTTGSGSHKYDLFIDHKKVSGDGFASANSYPLTAFSIYSERNSDGPNASWFVDDILIRQVEMDDEGAVNRAYDALSLDESELAGGQLTLAKTGLFGAAVKWLSSDEDVITSAGTVYRNAEAKKVTLTAAISKGDAARTKSFTVTVPADTGRGRGFTITGAGMSDGAISSVTLRNDSGPKNAVLVLLQYERGTLNAARAVPLPEITGTGTVENFTPVALSGGAWSYCRAYVWDVDRDAVASNIFRMEGKESDE